ncbi:MAG: hypothetical protein F6K24_15110 [Okeania sp. SIO2D1]|nr:hypothetical protein [Okeania sp. SIO2D1]
MKIKSKSVMIAGSHHLRSLSEQAIESLDKIMGLGLQVHIGDNPGVDLLVQLYLAKYKYKNVFVYAATRKSSHHKRLRYNLGMWTVLPCYGDTIHRDKCIAHQSRWLMLVGSDETCNHVKFFFAKDQKKLVAA